MYKEYSSSLRLKVHTETCSLPVDQRGQYMLKKQMFSRFILQTELFPSFFEADIYTKDKLDGGFLLREQKAN